MKHFILSIALLGVVISSSGCSWARKEVWIGGLVGAAAGAGIGYAVVHHGRNRQYAVQNTLITSAVFSVGTMAALGLHYHLVNEERVKMAAEFSRSWINEGRNAERVAPHVALDSGAEVIPNQSDVGKLSLQLDGETRWIYPTFRKRFIQPEASADQVLSERYSWEIVKPGYFVVRKTHPWFFEEDAKQTQNPETKIEVTP